MRIKRKISVILAAASAAVLGLTVLGLSSCGGRAVREPASAPPVAADAIQPENLRPEQAERKKQVCGPDSLERDTAADYSPKPTGWFPGYAKVLVDPHEALLAKVLLIQKAKTSIDISTYIYSPDLSSNAYLDELRKAVRRGVNVRFMVDAGGSLGEAITDQYRHLRTLLLDRKEAAGQGVHVGTVDVLVFHPILRFRSLVENIDERMVEKLDLSSEVTVNFDRRSHDKIIVIDKENKEDTYAIVGGRNIDDSYYGVPQVDQNTYVDMEILLKDDPSSTDPRTIASTLSRDYQNLFCSKGNRWLSLERFDSVLEGRADALEDLPTKRAARDLDGALNTLLEKTGLNDLYGQMKGASGFDFLNNGMIQSRLLPGNEIENLKRSTESVIKNPDAAFVDSLRNGDSIYYQIRRLIGKADKTVDLCTPYIFLPQNERDCLKKWVMDKQDKPGAPGRRVRIISNSAATSDSALALATFEGETAPDVMQDGHYKCEDPKTHVVSEGEFENKIPGSSDLKIQVYELGRLDNKMFTHGEVVDSRGQVVAPAAYYGKLHAKFGIFDGRYSFVGSDNLDERSRHLNSETGFFTDSREVASDLTAAFNGLVARSYLFGDPDLKIELARPEVKRRVETMDGFETLGKLLPQSEFAD